VAGGLLAFLVPASLWWEPFATRTGLPSAASLLDVTHVTSGFLRVSTD
jgi:hypothetical protein